MRGAGMHNLSVAVDDAGQLVLLMEEERVAIFGPNGAYRKCLDAQPGVADHRQVHRDCRSAHPYGRLPAGLSLGLLGRAPGRVAGQVQESCHGDSGRPRTHLRCRSGQRTRRIFDGNNHLTPQRIVKLPGGAGPLALALRGTLVATVTDRNSLLLLELAQDADSAGRCAGHGRGAAVRGLRSGRDHFRQRSTARPTATVCDDTNAGPVRWWKRPSLPPLMAKWPNLFPAATPMVAGPQGQIWFATDLYDKLLSLDPRSDTVRERGVPPWRTVALGFAHDGTLYTVGGSDKAGNTRISTFRVSGEGLQSLGAIPARSALSTDANMPIWGLLPDDDGGVYVRVVEPGYEKGWPALAIKKCTLTATMKPWLDFGPLYAKRRAFGPWEC